VIDLSNTELFVSTPTYVAAIRKTGGVYFAYSEHVHDLFSKEAGITIETKIDEELARAITSVWAEWLGLASYKSQSADEYAISSGKGFASANNGNQEFHEGVFTIWGHRDKEYTAWCSDHLLQLLLELRLFSSIIERAKNRDAAVASGLDLPEKEWWAEQIAVRQKEILTRVELLRAKIRQHADKAKPVDEGK
jgi:hypothetical protein